MGAPVLCRSPALIDIWRNDMRSCVLPAMETHPSLKQRGCEGDCGWNGRAWCGWAWCGCTWRGCTWWRRILHAQRSRICNVKYAQRLLLLLWCVCGSLVFLWTKSDGQKPSSTLVTGAAPKLQHGVNWCRKRGLWLNDAQTSAITLPQLIPAVWHFDLTCVLTSSSDSLSNLATFYCTSKDFRKCGGLELRTFCFQLLTASWCQIWPHVLQSVYLHYFHFMQVLCSQMQRSFRAILASTLVSQCGYSAATSKMQPAVGWRSFKQILNFGSLRKHGPMDTKGPL